MIADISKFTQIAEFLKDQGFGAEGPELIAFILNRYMEFLVQSITKCGGDIFRFVGDSIIALWPK